MLELSNHLKQAVRFIVRNELFRDTDRLQGLITHCKWPSGPGSLTLTAMSNLLTISTTEIRYQARIVAEPPYRPSAAHHCATVGGEAIRCKRVSPTLWHTEHTEHGTWLWDLMISALKATSQLKQNTQNPGAQTGLLDHVSLPSLGIRVFAYTPVSRFPQAAASRIVCTCQNTSVTIFDSLAPSTPILQC